MSYHRINPDDYDQARRAYDHLDSSLDDTPSGAVIIFIFVACLAVLAFFLGYFAAALGVA